MKQLVTAANVMFSAALEAVRCDGALLQRRLQRFAHEVRQSRSRSPGHFVVAMGKGAGALVDAWSRVCADDGFQAGVCVGPPPAKSHPGLVALAGSHPVPGLASARAAEAILNLLRDCDANTRVVFLISGGGSSMVEKPLWDDVSPDDMIPLHRALVGCGAPIVEMNTVRKHLSAIKGGRLAVAAAPASVFTALVSDVPDDDPHLIASGPTLADPSTSSHCRSILDRYGLFDVLPVNVAERIRRRQVGETPKPGTIAEGPVTVVLGSGDALEAARARGCELGIHACVDTLADEWPVERAAEELVGRLRVLRARHPGLRVGIIADGEVLSPVTGSGVGGRNQAFVVACAPLIEGDSVCVLSAGTDGIDGNSPAAGGWVDGETMARAARVGADAAESFRGSDTHGFLSALRQTLVTGPTGTNVRDLRILLAE